MLSKLKAWFAKWLHGKVEKASVQDPYLRQFVTLEKERKEDVSPTGRRNLEALRHQKEIDKAISQMASLRKRNIVKPKPGNHPGWRSQGSPYDATFGIRSNERPRQSDGGTIDPATAVTMGYMLGSMPDVSTSHSTRSSSSSDSCDYHSSHSSSSSSSYDSSSYDSGSSYSSSSCD